jgi:hypothetical protein
MPDKTADKAAVKSQPPYVAIAVAALGVIGSIGTAYVTAGNRAETTARTTAQTQAATSVEIATKIPIGTIVSSMLTPPKMKELFGDAWIPADGRNVSSQSSYAVATGEKSVPDLRGVFTRGLDQFDFTERPRQDTQFLDPDSKRKPGEPQPDSVGSHDHPVGQAMSDVGAVSPSGQVLVAEGGRFPSYYNDHYAKQPPARTSPNQPGDETRPKNVAVYFYIKIN